MIPHNIEVYIEELVLHDFAPKDRYVIGDAVQHELQRLFEVQGMSEFPASGYELGRLNGGTISLKPGAKAQDIGARVAQAIYAGLSSRSRTHTSRKDE